MRKPRTVSRASKDDPLERGLYTDRPTGPHGETAMMLVDRHGDVIVRVQIAYPEHAPAVRSVLAELLHELDPPPQLRII